MRGLGEAGVDHSGQNSGEDQSGGWRQVWGSRGRGRRVRTSRPDSAGEEEAGDAADLPVRFDLTGGHRLDGGELDNGGDGELGLGKKREKERGEQGGGKEQVSFQVVVGVLDLQHSKGGGPTSGGMASAWRQWPGSAL